jgi:hypothetical protein
MNRGAFVTGLGAVLAGAVAGEAQQPKMSTIGVLVVGAPGSANFWRLFQEAMSSGLTTGQGEERG